MQSWTQNTTRV